MLEIKVVMAQMYSVYYYYYYYYYFFFFFFCKRVRTRAYSCLEYWSQFKRRTLHLPNLMQISKYNSFCSLALGSAHVKLDVWRGPTGSSHPSSSFFSVPGR